jgi:hypothetical protein
MIQAERCFALRADLRLAEVSSHLNAAFASVALLHGNERLIH